MQSEDFIIWSQQLTLFADINDPHKTKGYLAHNSTDFVFIGPDRSLVCIDRVDQYVAMAKNYTVHWIAYLQGC